ncbi:MAG: WcaI family glycosyltransferase [Chitinophagaceae bacterium]
MNPKRVLLVGGNFKPELTGIGKYNGEMIDWLSSNGMECSVITTYPYYPQWEVHPDYKSKSYWFKTEKIRSQEKADVNIYRCPHYVPSKPTGARRMLSDLTFFMSAFVQVFLSFFHKKYDYVIAVAPPFHVGFLALFYKLITGTPMVYHIQDLQIDAASELGMIRQGWLLKLMFKMEAFLLKKSDYVSSISYGMISRIKTKTDKEVIFFPNWVDSNELYPIYRTVGLKEKFGFNDNEKIVLYSGAIGEKQGLENILLAAGQMNELPVRFVICGSGPYKEKLQEMGERRGLTNVTFLPLQPKESFNDFLNAADLHLVLQKANANDLVMPSKLTGILAVGGAALVTAPVGSSLYNYISSYKIATLAEPEDLSALINGISKVLFDGSHTSTSQNAYRFADEFLNIDRIIPNFLSQISPAELGLHPGVRVARANVSRQHGSDTLHSQRV